MRLAQYTYRVLDTRVETLTAGGGMRVRRIAGDEDSPAFTKGMAHADVRAGQASCQRDTRALRRSSVPVSRQIVVATNLDVVPVCDLPHILLEDFVVAPYLVRVLVVRPGSKHGPAIGNGLDWRTEEDPVSITVSKSLVAWAGLTLTSWLTCLQTSATPVRCM
jgi:hypothetical protein